MYVVKDVGWLFRCAKQSLQQFREDEFQQGSPCLTNSERERAVIFNSHRSSMLVLKLQAAERQA
jgi:hypothetical protein